VIQEHPIVRNVLYDEKMIARLLLIRGQRIRVMNRSHAKFASKRNQSILATFCFALAVVVNARKTKDGTVSKNLLALTA
jgi:hypothetical protein